MTAPIGKPEIAALIPHAGAMCLLDAVRFWDSTTIVCTASSHRDANNPLASGGRLDTICGIEYAAQAMAVHGGLTATARLDLLPGDLEVTATMLAGDNAAAMYGFVVRCGAATILEGRAAVVIDAGRRSA